MLNITIVAVGKLKEKYLADGCAEYLKRLQAFCKCEVIELDEWRLPASPSQAQIDDALQKESKAIAAKLPPQAYLVAMCVEGGQHSSESFAEEFEKAAQRGKSSIAFVIGGSFGLAEELKASADLRLSLSKMTLPHHMARFFLLEQVYRAMTITANMKYHK